MTLREIAEKMNWRKENSFINERDADIAFLLKAVVEERQKFIKVESFLDWICVGKIGPSPSMFMEDYIEKALDELGLKGVWPVKED